MGETIKKIDTLPISDSLKTAISNSMSAATSKINNEVIPTIKESFDFNQTSEPEELKMDTPLKAGSISQNDGSTLEAMQGVIGDKAKILKVALANDGISNYDISNYAEIPNGIILADNKEGENSRLYLNNLDGSLKGAIVLDNPEDIKKIDYDQEKNQIVVELVSGEEISYDISRMDRSIELTNKYDGTNISKYYKADGDKVVEAARNQIGHDYENAGVGPDAFDCSGLVSYCLCGEYHRLGTTYTFLDWPQTSDPKPGDICVNAGHTGIYIGDGQMIHAADYGIGVIEGPVQDGMIFVEYPGNVGEIYQPEG